MITPGGETGFVKRLIAESLHPRNKHRIQWFTSMVGKISSVGTIVEVLREEGCDNWAVTEFVQGQKTRRWGIGWSWGSKRPNVKTARGVPGLEKRLLPFPSEFMFEMGQGRTMAEVGRKVDIEIRNLEVRWQWREAIGMGIGFAKEDVWSRKARRRKGKAQTKEIGEDEGTNGAENEESSDEEEQESALVFRLSLSPGEGSAVVAVNIRWLQGSESVLFESFCGWVRRKLEKI